MAPKKSSKGKGAAVELAHEEGWNTSKCSESDFETLVSDGLLVPRSVIQWRPALGKDHPYENTGESLLSHLFWNGDWDFLVHLSCLGSCTTTGSCFIT